MDKRVEVTIPWESADKTGAEVFKVYMNTMLDAIRSNAHNYNSLEDIRKELICLTMEIENIQYKLKAA